VKTIASAFGVSRSNLIERMRPSDQTLRVRAPRSDDVELVGRIRCVVDERGRYGDRRVTALLNRPSVQVSPRVNHKRVYRLMKREGLLLQRHTGKSTRTHDGVVITRKSDLRWCSDSFEIRCWNAERVQVAFALDCCDREAMSYVATTAAVTGRNGT
jgi:transposase InsO family protein